MGAEELEVFAVGERGGGELPVCDVPACPPFVPSSQNALDTTVAVHAAAAKRQMRSVGT